MEHLKLEVFDMSVGRTDDVSPDSTKLREFDTIEYIKPVLIDMSAGQADDMQRCTGGSGAAVCQGGY